MSYSVNNPEDLVNLALTRIGYPMRINNIYEGTKAAVAALDVYGQTRDQLLFANDWSFSERNVAATLLKSAPPGGYFPPAAWNPAVNPPVPWSYEYTYPSDAIKIRSVRGQPLYVLDFDPQPNVFTTENDSNYTPARRVILSNVPVALIVYTGRVTDLTTWDDDAVETFAAALAKRIAPALAKPEVERDEVADEALEEQRSTMERPT